MSYSLPKYYFQDIHPDVMDEIMREMNTALPEPSWEEIDAWLNTHNITSNVPGGAITSLRSLDPKREREHSRSFFFLLGTKPLRARCSSPDYGAPTK
jgi:hypothetical protein